MASGLSNAWGDGHNLGEYETYASLERIKDIVQVGPEDLALNDTDTNSDGHTEWDQLLVTLKEDAKALIDSYSGKVFAHYQDQTLLLDGGSRIIRLPRPTLDVHQVRESGSTVDEGSWTAKRSGQLVKTGTSGRDLSNHYGAGVPYSASSGGKSQWRDGFGNVEVTLDYGYPDPPEEIRAAETKLVDHALIGLVQKRESPVVQVDDYSVDANIPVSMNSEVEGLLPDPRTEVGI